MTWREEALSDGVRLICGDCREILPTFGKVDAVVTDPAYGINAARTRNSQKWGWTDFESAWLKVVQAGSGRGTNDFDVD